MRAAGVAFSGASSRGVAHLGVLRGYSACGLPLDLVAGSSSGAAIAALATLGLPHEEMLEKGETTRILTRGGGGGGAIQFYFWVEGSEGTDYKDIYLTKVKLVKGGQARR